MTPGRDPLIRRHRNRGDRRRTVVAVGAGVLTGVALLVASVAAAVPLGLHPWGTAAGPGNWLAPPEATPSPGAPAAAARPPSGKPTWVRIPSIGVSAPLDPLSLDATGALQPPSNFDDAGWYAGGTAPGDIGPAVIAGHIDSKCCAAVFYKLADLKQGDEVKVERGDQWLTFTVTRSAKYPKTDFPTQAVYGPTPDAELRLITCGGDFDSAHSTYVDNVVVYAVATP